MNLDELRSVQSKERRKDSLQQLRESFYQDVAAYIQDLRAERDRRAEQVDNPFSDDEVRRLSDELDTAEEVAEALYERRVGKVVKLASFAAAEMSASEEGMTIEEQALFDDLVDRIKQNKASVLDVLAGEGDATGGTSSATATDTDTASPATAAREPTADDEPTTIGGANAEHASKAAETPEQPPPQQAAADGMLADAMGAATEREEASDGSAADNPARRAAGDINTAEGATDAAHTDTEQTDGESGIPTTDGGSTTAATPTSKSTPSAESTPTTESTPHTEPSQSTTTTPSQPSQSASAAPDSSASAETTRATPETATESTESASQPTESAPRSAEAATEPPEPTVDHDHPTERSTADAGAENASPAESASADTATSESIDRTTVRITESVGTILGTDEREYSLMREDVVTLPAANAEALLSKDAAVEIEYDAAGSFRSR